MMTLTEARERADVGVGEMAEVLGVSPGTLWRWEVGESVLPAWALQQMARRYGVSSDDIELPKKNPRAKGGDASS